jgi:hypothetical protein
MTEAQAKQAVKEFSPSNAQKKEARENALDENVNTSKGSIIIKPQLCGKYCGTCPHGPTVTCQTHVGGLCFDRPFD